jgi:clan AA aspartic protease
VGLIYTRVTLGNARRPEIKPIEVDALVDTGALHLCIPEHVVLQLELDEFDRREPTFADGSKRLAPYVGPLTVAVANRKGLSGAMVVGDEVLLGAIPMEDMDLVARPATRDVIPNPKNPNIAVSVAKGFRTNHES